MNSKKYKSDWFGGQLNKYNRLCNQTRYFEEDGNLYLEVQLNHDKVMVCDLADQNLIESYLWYFNKNTCVNMKGSRFHKMIYPNWKTINHINGDTLDNRRFNLCERDKRNHKLRRDNKSGIKGLCYHKKGRRWGYHYYEGKRRKAKYFYGAKKTIKAQVIEFIKNNENQITIDGNLFQGENVQEEIKDIQADNDAYNFLRYKIDICNFHESIASEQGIDIQDIKQVKDDVKDDEYYKLCDEYLNYDYCLDNSIVAIIKRE